MTPGADDGRGHTHGHSHAPGRSHDPGHQHAHGHAHDDWAARAESLVLDATMLAPLYADVTSMLDWSGVRRILDVGCGPGVVACALARLAPDAEVIALDHSTELLDAVRRRADQEGVGARVRTLHGNLDTDLGGAGEADLVWAGMVLHHAADPGAAVAAVARALRPGGTLVAVEFGPPVEVLPADDPLTLDGTWSRYAAASMSALRAHLQLDPDSIPWLAHFAAAGLTDVRDHVLTATHHAPLGDTARRWLAGHVRRGLDATEGVLAPRDRAAIGALADAIPARDDLTARLHRRVLVGRLNGS